VYLTKLLKRNTLVFGFNIPPTPNWC